MQAHLTKLRFFMRHLSFLFAVFAMLITLMPATSPAQAQSIVSPDMLVGGDLIRGESFNAVYYYGEDGMRYVFPNSKAYFTWYENFDSVRWLSDADMGTIQIGGNVTYRPGVKMIKINSDPKTYAIDENGTLRWVTSEDIAISLYGNAWNTMIDDVPDAFFGNYTKGTSIESVDDYDATIATIEAADINKDKGLRVPTVAAISDNTFDSPTITIRRNTAVRFENNGSNKHTATADDLTWGTGTMTTGQHFTRYFENSGTYTYFDSYHPDTMNNGVIIVE